MEKRSKRSEEIEVLENIVEEEGDSLAEEGKTEEE